MYNQNTHGGVIMKLNVKKVEEVAPTGDNPWG